MEKHLSRPSPTLDEIRAADAEARRAAMQAAKADRPRLDAGGRSVLLLKRYL